MMVVNRAAFEKGFIVKVSEIEKLLIPKVEEAMRQLSQMTRGLFPGLGFCIQCASRGSYYSERPKKIVTWG